VRRRLAKLDKFEASLGAGRGGAGVLLPSSPTTITSTSMSDVELALEVT
jgi:hypothetical protein